MNIPTTTGRWLTTAFLWLLAATLQAASPQTSQPTSANNPLDLAGQKKLAAQGLLTHSEPAALTAASAAVAAAPDDVEARELLVRALARSGRYDDALDAYRDKSAPASTNALARTIEAATQASQATRNLQEAVLSEQRSAFVEVCRRFELAVQADPENLAVRKTVGWVYLDKLHDAKAAYPHLKLVIRHHPADVDARKLLALAASQSGHLAEAAEEFRTVLKQEPDDVWMKVNLARTQARRGSRSEAATLYAEVLRREPANYTARLGQAELAAWRGDATAAEVKLRKLLDESPDNPEAGTLLADVHRWDWRLSEARTEYARVLRATPHYGEAERGQEALQDAGGWSVRLDGYHFKDSEDFSRYSAAASVRAPLSDRVYLVGQAGHWWFEHPAFATRERTDGQAGLEVHFARWLEVTGEGAVYNYEHRDPFFGGQVSSKLSIGSGCDIFNSVSLNHPFISSITTVLNGLREDSLGSGLDLQLGRGFSIQNSLQLGRISDDNEWIEEKPQLSYQLLRAPVVFLRVEHDYLNYSELRTGYWTPRHRNVLTPMTDISVPLSRSIQIQAVVKAPYVFDTDEFGFQLESGFTCEITRGLQLNATYLHSSIPGDKTPWSGSGWQASLRCRL